MVDAERELAERQITLAALELAATLRPRSLNGGGAYVVGASLPRAEAAARPTGSRGKAPGTISNQWRAIMGKVVVDGNQAWTPDLWALAATETGHPMETKAARDWLRRAAEGPYGYIERQGEGYRVGAAAIEKFNLKTAAPPPEVPGDGAA